ncbi:MAG: acyltransferase [Bacteroidetes bacterium]|nr:acyltransferase [Bacteroidota bacterium]
MPLYWLTTILALAVFLYNPKIVNTSGGETSIWASFVLFPNGKKFLNSIGWTLSFEFFYYLIFAVFIGWGTGKAMRWSSVVLLILVGLGLWLGPTGFLTNILFLEFVFGMACFYVFNKKGVRLGMGVSVALCVLGVAILVVEQVLRVPKQEVWRGFYWGIPMLFIFSGLYAMEGLIQRGKSFVKAGLLGIGNSSYSLYLTHPFVLSGTAMCLKRLGMAGNPWFFTVVLLVVAIAVGHMVYLFVEKPMTGFVKKVFAPRPTSASQF